MWGTFNLRVEKSMIFAQSQRQETELIIRFLTSEMRGFSYSPHQGLDFSLAKMSFLTLNLSRINSAK